MVEKTVRTGEDAIEASGDSLVIADAIYAGLSEIAKAIRSMNEISENEYGEPVQAETYLDGSPFR